MTPDQELEELAIIREETAQVIQGAKERLKELDEEIIEKLGDDLAKIYGSEKGQKTYGETTFEKGSVVFTVAKRKTVKYDTKAVVNAARNLNWEELNKFFKVKFEMGETEYRELQAAAMDSEKFSDILSQIDDTREVKIHDTQVKKVQVTS